MAVSPRAEATDLISFAILCNGKEISSTIEITAIKVLKEVNLVDKAIISIHNSYSVTDRKLDLTDSNTLPIDSDIEIKLGYHSKNNSVFKGIVTQQKMSLDSNERPILEVFCEHYHNEAQIIRQQNINIHKTPVLEVAHGSEILETELTINRLNDKRVKGFIKTQGTSIVNINDNIKIEAGYQFSSTTFISGIEHEVKNGQWYTTLNVGYTID